MKGSGRIPPRCYGERRDMHYRIVGAPMRRPPLNATKRFGRAAHRRPYTDNDRTPASIAAPHSNGGLRPKTLETSACAQRAQARSFRVLRAGRQKSPFPGLLYQWLLNNLPGGEPGTQSFAAGFPDPVSSRAKPPLSLRLCPLDEGVRRNPAALLWGTTNHVASKS